MTNQADYQGQIKNEELGPDDLRVNMMYTYWFTQMDGDIILYYSIKNECLRTFDLSKPNQDSKQWSGNDIKVDRDHVHNFIWLHYDSDEKAAYLLHNAGPDKVKMDKIVEGGAAIGLGEVDCKNTNWMYKAPGTKLFFACNNEGKNFPIFMAHKNGITKINMEISSDVTLIEMGFLTDNKMVLIWNAGEKAEVGCFLVNLGNYSLETNTEISLKEEGDDVEKVVLHKDGEDSIMADAYFLVNKVMQSITVTTAGNQLATFRIGEENGKVVCTAEPPVDANMTNFQNVASNFSLDRGSMLCFEEDRAEKNVVHVASHRLTDLKCMYAWIMSNASQNLYDPGDVANIVKLLV